MHQIKVRIKPDGTTEVSVDGLAGSACKDVTKALEKALGNTTSDKPTADLYKAAQGGVHLTQGGGS